MRRTMITGATSGWGEVLLSRLGATDRAKSLGILPELAAANPLGRAAEPSEMAEFVTMLASRRNTYMTGEQVIVSGGYVYV